MSASEAKPAAVSKATQTEDDWDEVKADVKRLINSLRSLDQQPKAVESGREFGYDDQRAQILFCALIPTPERLETFALFLVSIFTAFRRDDGIFQFLGESVYLAQWLPFFADKMVLRMPKEDFSEAGSGEFLEISPDTPPVAEAARLREYLMNQKAEAYQLESGYEFGFGGRPVGNDPRDRQWGIWQWAIPDSEGNFRLYYFDSNNKRIESQEPLTAAEEIDFESLSVCGYGTLCLIKVPVRDGVLNLRWVNLIVAQISRWNFLNTHDRLRDWQHLSHVLYFLGIFAGFWPSQYERQRFSLSECMEDPSTSFDRWYLQVHFRYFAPAAQPMENKNVSGLKCSREKGKIVSEILQVDLHSFEEKRISVFGLLSTTDNESQTAFPAFYTVLALGETNIRLSGGYKLKSYPGLEGTIAFQIAVLASVDAWERGWNTVLDQIDKCLHVQLGQTLDPEEINKWMFDNNFERSRLYFTMLQILRIFSEYISTVSDDLRLLDKLFLEQSRFPMPEMRQVELQTLRSNWLLVKETQKTAQQNLLDRVLNKTEEIKSLRDGLFNASSLREAGRSLDLGRYVLIFTVVTVLYLPPSFISTVFALDIFQKDPAETKFEYKVALVTVSLVTYTVALAFVIALDWKKLRRRCSSWWSKFSRWWGTPFSGNEAGPANERGDEESGPRKARRHRFPGFSRVGKSGEASGKKEKGKAPAQQPEDRGAIAQ